VMIYILTFCFLLFVHVLFDELDTNSLSLFNFMWIGQLHLVCII